MNRDIAEPEVDSLLALHLLALSARLAERTAGLGDWLDTPPIVLDVSEDTAVLPVEEVFARESGALRTVCHRPSTRLRSVEEVLPASRVRRIAAGAAARLAAHPEDWASHTLAGVRPGRLLARRSDEVPDIYENRVAVSVLHLMRSHLQRRIAKVNALSRMVDDVHGLVMSSGGSTWRALRDVTELLRNIEDPGRRRAEAEVRIRDLESALMSVEVMLGSPLARALGRPAVPPRELHPTNLFTGNVGYRRVADLWRACTAAEAPPAAEAEIERRRQEVHTAFERFTGLLLLLACTLLRAIPEDGQPAPGRGRSTRFRLHDAPLSVTWTELGDFTVDWRGDRVLRILPVVADLCTAADSAAVAAAISTARRDRPPLAYGTELVVYPGSPETYERAAADVASAAYGIGSGPGSGTGDGTGPRVDVAPLSPLEVFSVSRLARALRWATLGTDAGSYPPVVRMSVDERSALATCAWLSPHADGAAVVRAPFPSEADRVGDLLERSRPRRGGAKASAHEVRRRQELRALLENAARVARLLEACPMCVKSDPARPTAFEPREGGLFAASCPSCRTRWELRRCPSCTHTFPFLAAAGVAEVGAPEPDLDRRLGGSLLALPCWAEGRRGHGICPACGACGQAGRVTSCPRGCGG